MQNKDNPYTSLERKTEVTASSADKRFTSALESNQELKKGKKKKKILIFSGLAVALVAVIVVVIVVTTSKGNDPGPSPPGPNPNGTPLDFKEYNPFVLESTTFKE